MSADSTKMNHAERARKLCRDHFPVYSNPCETGAAIEQALDEVARESEERGTLRGKAKAYRDVIAMMLRANPADMRCFETLEKIEQKATEIEAQLKRTENG